MFVDKLHRPLTIEHKSELVETGNHTMKLDTADQIHINLLTCLLEDIQENVLSVHRFIVGTLGGDLDSTSWDNRTDGVLVNHLLGSVHKHEGVLIERLDVPLELDTVDQVDRDWYTLTTKRVQEGVLQGVAFVAHGFFSV